MILMQAQGHKDSGTYEKSQGSVFIFLSSYERTSARVSDNNLGQILPLPASFKVW